MRKKKILMIGIVVCIVIGIVVVAGCKFGEQKRSLNEKGVEEQNKERVELAKKNERVSIIVSNANAYKGDTVTLEVSIVNNPGILGMSLSLAYDEKIMQLIEVQNGEAFNNVLDLNYSKELGNGCIFLWDGEDISKDQIADGGILKLVFKVLDSASIGKTSVVLLDDEGGTVDKDLNTVDVSIENGYITVVD